MTSVNDAPVLDDFGAMVMTPINEDDRNNSGTQVTDIIASAGGDRITDIDVAAVEGIAVTAVFSTHGEWQYSIDAGVTWLAFGTPSTAASRLLGANLNTRIRCIPNDNFNGTISTGLRFRAWDQTSGNNGGTAMTSSTGGITAFSTAVETAGLTINSVNDAPAAISLSATSIAENRPSGTTVGTLTATDPDIGDTLTYALISGTGSTDNNSFAISSNTLKTTASFNFEAQSSYAIRVKVTDAGGLTSEQPFTINVTDVVEVPVITGPDAATPNLRPTMAWTAVAGATEYELWVTKEPSSSLYHEATVTGISYTPAMDFGIGTFNLRVRANDSVSVGQWTPGYVYVINTAATLQSITHSQPTLRPTISWNALPGAAKYDVWINDVSRGITQHIRNMNVSGTSFIPSADLPLGVYRVWVRGIAADNTTVAAWSTGKEFVTMQAPTITQGQNSTFDRTPTFSWNELSGAAKYEVFIRNRNTGATTINQTNITDLSFTPSTPIPDGLYRWWALGVSAQGRARWGHPAESKFSEHFA